MSKIRIALIFLLWTGIVCAQERKPAFWNDIQVFKKQDSVSFPPDNAILFMGSSSFTNWNDVEQYFPSYKIINRGFGGSSLPDEWRWNTDERYFPG